MVREKPAVPGLRFVTTQALIAELQRRALGCMIAIVRAEENGDAWRFSLKGSPILLGALSAALSIEIDKKLRQIADAPQSLPTLGGTHDQRSSLRHPGAA